VNKNGGRLKTWGEIRVDCEKNARRVRNSIRGRVDISNGARRVDSRPKAALQASPAHGGERSKDHGCLRHKAPAMDDEGCLKIKKPEKNILAEKIFAAPSCEGN